MQFDLNTPATIVLIVALVMLLGPHRFMYFGRDLQKAWNDFRRLFRR